MQVWQTLVDVINIGFPDLLASTDIPWHDIPSNRLLSWDTGLHINFKEVLR